MKLVCIGGVADGKREDVPDDARIWNVCIRPDLMSFPKFDPPSMDITQDIRYDEYCVESLHCGNKIVVKLLRHKHLQIEQLLHRLIHHYRPPNSAGDLQK